MELTLKRLLEQAKFTTGRKGYDQGEVDDFLDRAVAMATKVEAKLTEAMEQAGAAPSAPGPSAEELEAEIERRVQARLEEERAAAPAAPAGPSEEERAEEVRRTLVLAQRTADAAVKEAREEADALLAEARERATTLAAAAEADAFAQREAVAAEVEQERREARERLSGEIRALEGAREALRSDVTLLEGHVEEQRAQLRSTLGELQRLLDDPAGFRLAPAPALSDPVIDLPGDEASAGAPDEPPAEADVPEPIGAGADRGDDPVTVVDLREGGGPSDEPSAPEARTGDVSEPEPEVAGPSTAGGAVEIGEAAVVDAPDPLPLAIEEIDHEVPGVQDPSDSGPPTAPVAALDLDFGVAPPASVGTDGDDAFLAELRKAMADEEPLGPRDVAGEAPGGAFYDDDRRGWRFGKRR